jgi:tagatose 1,6-diphosphate aldolase
VPLSARGVCGDQSQNDQGQVQSFVVCADANGVIAAAAADQRGSLQKSIAKARGENGTASAQDLSMFKSIVTRYLDPTLQCDFD